MKVLILIFLPVIILSCSQNNREKVFVEKYLNEDFDRFKNKGFTIREFNRDGNPVIFISDGSSEDFGIYTLVINYKTKSIESTSKHLMKGDSVIVNELYFNSLNELGVDFLKYKLHKLCVDNARNVYIGFESKEKWDLVRVENLDSLRADFKYHAKSWESMHNNWFRIRDGDGSGGVIFNNKKANTYQTYLFFQ